MKVTPAEAKAQVQGFLALRRTPLLFLEDGDGRGARLLETGSGQELRLRWEDLAAVEEKHSAERPAPWLVLLFEDGRQLALADVGFAFAPSPRNSGPLPELPATACFRDLGTLLSGIDALLAGEGREAEAARAFLVAIALVDGARDAGFVVAREERALEERLGRLEERGVPR